MIQFFPTFLFLQLKHPNTPKLKPSHPSPVPFPLRLRFGQRYSGFDMADLHILASARQSPDCLRDAVLRNSAHLKAIRPAVGPNQSRSWHFRQRVKPQRGVRRSRPLIRYARFSRPVAPSRLRRIARGRAWSSPARQPASRQQTKPFRSNVVDSHSGMKRKQH